jgi:uncharacterized repeat protein (TIGR02543 family)
MMSILAALVIFSLPVACNNEPGSDETYTLTVDKNPTSGGTVTLNPNKTSYNVDEQVIVTATANTGYTFTGWSGASSAKTASVTITMNRNKTLTATFESSPKPIKYILTVNKNPTSGGTVTLNPNKANYDAGEQVTVTAVANNGYTFDKWSGASAATTAIVIITMDANKTLTAMFESGSEPIKYTLAVNSNPTGGGTVTRNPNKANYDAGEQVTVIAVANNGYTFDKWSGASTATTASVNITMDSNKTLTAMFEKNSAEEPVPGSDLRIYVNKTNNTFEVDGKRIWINGANTPWDKWNDFGGTGWMAYNDSFWDAEFGRLHTAGINATRIWINCNNLNNAITIATNGTVSGVSAQHWTDLDKLFALATKHKIYIMATLLSFDHFESNDDNSWPNQPDRWQAMIKSQPASKSFVDNYTIPFVNRYKDNPYLWSIDIMNEPDWLFEHTEASKIPWNNISYFLGLNAAAIHENSDILVTVGMASVKYNADGAGYEGNKVADTYLKNLTSKQNAYLDFWSPHYYDWVGEWYGVPHYLTPSGTRGGNKTSGWTGGWGLDGSKPAVLGECAAKGTTPGLWGTNNSNTIITDYETAYSKGWQGVMPWTSNGKDAEGNLTDFSPATLNMKTKYPALIYPWD